jgi:hypothetical protein
MLRTLVYASPDSHLWRELFLSIWDDPRPALQHRSLIDPRVAEHSRDWGVEYRRRVVADKWLKSWRSSVSVVFPYMPLASVLSNEAALLLTLRTLLDTFLTMTPFPASPTMSLTALTPNLEPVNAASTLGESRERMARAPPFPPLLLLLASGLEVIPPSRSGVRLGRIAYGPHASRTRTIADAYRSIPTPSLPPQLTRTLLGSFWTSAQQLPFFRGIENGTGDEVGEVFHHIVCITGFVPIPLPLPTALAPSSASTSTPSIAPDQASLPWSSDSDAVPPFESQRQTNDFPTRAEQYADARRLAKRRVYDMQYLRGDRMWGPYQVVERDVLDSDVAGGGEKKGDMGRRGASAGGRASGGRAGGLGTLAWAMGMDVDDYPSSASSDDDDDDDEDWHDDEEHGDVWYPGERDEGDDDDGNDADGEDGEDGELDGGEHVHVHVENGEPDSPTNATTSTEALTNVTTSTDTHTRTRTLRSNPRRPPSTLSPLEIKPHQLKPDYVYLASVRIVAEANLREMFKAVASEEEGEAGDVGSDATFWEDEDEILRTHTGGAAADASTRMDADADVNIGTSGGSALAGVASYEARDMPTGTSTTPHTVTHTLELTDLLAAIRNVEVARVGGACGYWGGWIGKGGEGDSEKGGIAGGRRPPRVVTRRRELESVGGNGATTEGATSGRKGKGKGKQSVESAGLDSGLGDWEVGAEGEACEGWDWAGVAGLWR